MYIYLLDEMILISILFWTQHAQLYLTVYGYIVDMSLHLNTLCTDFELTSLRVDMSFHLNTFCSDFEITSLWSYCLMQLV